MAKYTGLARFKLLLLGGLLAGGSALADVADPQANAQPEPVPADSAGPSTRTQTPLRYVVMAAVLCAVALVVRWDRRRTGMFVNGYRAGRTRVVTVALLIAMPALAPT